MLFSPSAACLGLACLLFLLIIFMGMVVCGFDFLLYVISQFFIFFCEIYVFYFICFLMVTR